MRRDRKLEGQFTHTDNPHRHTRGFKNRIAERIHKQPLENALSLFLRKTRRLSEEHPEHRAPQICHYKVCWCGVCLHTRLRHRSARLLSLLAQQFPSGQPVLP